MKLFDIDQQLERLFPDGDNMVDVETGEVFDKKALDDLKMERVEKVTNIGKYILNLRAEAKAIKEEEQALAARRKAKENRADWLQQYMDSSLKGQKFECVYFNATYRKSVAVEVKDQKAIPKTYLIPQEPKVDKMGIKKALKAGENVPGCVLVERNNLSIK